MPLGIIFKKYSKKIQIWTVNLWNNFRFKQNSTEGLAKRQVLNLSTIQTWPKWKQWRCLPRILSPAEKRTLQISLAVTIISFFLLCGWLIVSRRIEIPAVGGTYTEGLIGSPQFINPLYASANDVDSDLTRLVYSGLFRWESPSGLVPDLAESYTVSEDQKTYIIKLRTDARWHNNDPVTANDVVFTIQSIKNPAYHSPLFVSFQSVEISQVDENTVQFILKEPFAQFLSTLTVGILPANLWQEILPRNAALASLNLSPIGSGPYCFDKFSLDKKGEIRSYTLIRNANYYTASPKIEHLTFKFYPDIEAAVTALQNQNIEGISFIPHYLTDVVKKNRSIQILQPTMPQEVILFFNQNNQPLLKDEKIRQALALALNKQTIVDQVLNNYGSVIDGPILPNTLGFNAEVNKINQDLNAAKELLKQTDYTEISPDGYLAKKTKITENSETKETLEILTLNLTTVNQPDFLKTAEIIAEQAKAVGIKIQIETTDSNELYENIIKPRTYQMLLTAIQFGLDLDPYPFWHSSQIKYPGLNLALYANREVDKLLEKSRTTANPEERITAFTEFQNLIAEDLPAIFLYQPSYVYIVSDKIKNISLEGISVPADRFQHIADWYIKTKQVFK